MNGTRARLGWRCRRGTRELDLLLATYLEQAYDQAPVPEQAAFESLLALPDPELAALLSGTSVHPTAALNALADKIRAQLAS
ncbi:succinate dehydrogenase assembly factor 2 [Methylococcus sp. EFPC2]|uniref:FAD assembly factor SdhE n=1 Tax=Methylococcus sp. EFPC2 TaxID=2812648 RepID=UPI001967E402|nr:succinate dehydrogenase assembly factor 2 [Methylococcus sp. EFPC2]QSA95565.1 succinate dehydrogenase assembly factor 2 [Methylococcus sp. EFPC2]